MPETQAAPASAAPQISFSEAFWFWLKLGFISFGGPAGQIAIMEHDRIVLDLVVILAIDPAF